MKPEEALADRLAAGLSVPVDVESLVKKYADIVDASMPEDLDVDAVSIGLDGQLDRPRVIMNARRTNVLRRRFTLAHELGHILIPWHIGTIGCNSEGADDGSNPHAAKLENEANRFAARLLIPQEWLLDEVIPRETGEEVFDCLSDAGASALPLLLRLVSELPSGYIILLSDSNSPEPRVFRSANTLAPKPTGWVNLDRLNSDQRGSQSLAGRNIRWWRWDLADPPYPEFIGSGFDESQSANARRDVLRKAGTKYLHSAFKECPTSTPSENAIAGVVGVVQSKAKVRSASYLDCALRQRFSDVAEFGPLVLNAKFRMFLGARAWQFSKNPFGSA